MEFSKNIFNVLETNDVCLVCNEKVFQKNNLFSYSLSELFFF